MIIFKVSFGTSCSWASGGGGKGASWKCRLFGCPVLHPCQQWLNPPSSKSPQHLVVSGLGCSNRSAVVACCLNSQVPGRPCWNALCIWWVFVSVSCFDIRYVLWVFACLEISSMIFDKFMVCFRFQPFVRYMYDKIYPPFWLIFSLFDNVLFGGVLLFYSF